MIQNLLLNSKISSLSYLQQSKIVTTFTASINLETESCVPFSELLEHLKCKQ